MMNFTGSTFILIVIDIKIFIVTGPMPTPASLESKAQ